MDSLQDGLANVLFVGRITPHKKQSDLVVAFSRLLDMDERMRLILVVEFLPGDPCYDELLESVARMQLEDRVRLPGKVAHAELNAYYRTAHLYWSMSEHEGFGVPLVEAMWFDIPVLAFKCTAVPETLGIGGIQFFHKQDLLSVAALAKLLVHDSTLRFDVLNAQRKRRRAFLPEVIGPIIDQLIMQLDPPHR